MTSGINFIDYLNDAEEYDAVEEGYKLRLKRGADSIEYMHVQTSDPCEIARITPQSEYNGLDNVVEFILYNYTDTVDMDTVTILNHNQATANVNILYSVAGDSGFISSYNDVLRERNHIILFPNIAVNVDIVLIRIYNIEGELDIGKIIIGNTMKTCVDGDWSRGITSRTGRSDSYQGTSFLREMPRYKKGTYQYTLIPYAEAYGGFGTFEHLAETAAKDSPVVIMPDITDEDELHNQFIYGTLTNDVIIQKQSGVHYQTKLDIKELI